MTRTALLGAICAVLLPTFALAANPVTVTDPGGVNKQGVDSSGNAKIINPAVAVANGCSLALKATATACGTSAGHTISTIFVGNFSNNNEQCLELFDLATGSVTPGTTTPTKFWDIAGGWAGNINLPPGGLVFTTAVTVAVVKVASCAWSGATSSDTNNIVVTTTGPN